MLREEVSGCPRNKMRTQVSSEDFRRLVTEMVKHLGSEAVSDLNIIDYNAAFLAFNKFKIKISLDQRSKYISCNIFIGGNSFELSEFYNLGEPLVGRSSGSSPQSTERALAEIGRGLRERAFPTIRQIDPTEHLLARRAEWGRKLEVLTRYGPTRSLAIRAFREGNYSKVVEIYSKFDDLTQSERKRLELSLERIHSKRH